MIELADVFRRFAPDYLAAYRASMLPSHRRAIEDIIACRTSALGGQLWQCDTCEREVFSCGYVAEASAYSVVAERKTGAKKTPADPFASQSKCWECVGGAGSEERRHDRLADYRILVIEEHPLCPTATNVVAAVNGLAERLQKAGCAIRRRSDALPDLAQTSRVYRGLRRHPTPQTYRRIYVSAPMPPCGPFCLMIRAWEPTACAVR